MKVLSGPARPLSYIARRIRRVFLRPKKLGLLMIGEVPSVPQRILHVPIYALALLAHNSLAEWGEFLMKMYRDP